MEEGLLSTSIGKMKLPRFLLMLLYRPVRLFPVIFCLAVVFSWATIQLNRSNPNSHFFEPDESTFDSKFTDLRKAHGRKYVDEAASKGSHIRPTPPSSTPELGVVFVSVMRREEQYLDASLGSFLMELTPTQREKMYIIASIGDNEPANNAVLERGFLDGLVDEIATRKDYNGTSHPRTKFTKHIMPELRTDRMPMKTKAWHQRASIDYSLALQKCIDIGATHCLVVEDDTVFASQWYAQFQEALLQAQKSYAGPHPWAYLRLFYAEKYFGWENHEVPLLIRWIAGSVAASVVLLFLFARFPAHDVVQVQEKPHDYLGADRSIPWDDVDDKLRKSTSNRKTIGIPLGTIFLLGVLVLHVCIFAILSGRNHFYSVPKGVSNMPSRGCCTQAMVYPLDVLAPLIEHIRHWHLQSPYDININRWVEGQERIKLALHPPLVQHIGTGSSRQMVEYAYDRSTPLWSFAFEKWQALRSA